jgi:hypothetical protein
MVELFRRERSRHSPGGRSISQIFGVFCDTNLKKKLAEKKRTSWGGGKYHNPTALVAQQELIHLFRMHVRDVVPVHSAKHVCVRVREMSL